MSAIAGGGGGGGAGTSTPWWRRGRIGRTVHTALNPTRLAPSWYNTSRTPRSTPTTRYTPNVGNTRTTASPEQRNRDAFRTAGATSNRNTTGGAGAPPGGSGPASWGPGGAAANPHAAAIRNVPSYTPVSGSFTPGMENYDYAPYIERLRALENAWGASNTKWGVRPEAFEYEDWGGRDPQVDIARQRVQGEMDYATPFMRQAAAQAQQAAANQLTAQRGYQAEDVGNIQRAGEMDFGRLANMGANMGLGAGQGAMENMYGSMAGVQNNVSNIMRDYAGQRADTELERDRQLGDIRAEELGMRASAEGRTQGLADELAMQDFDRYATLRGMAGGEHFQHQDNRMSAEQSRLNALYQSLMGREGAIGAQTGLLADQRNFQWNDWWRNKDFNYTEQWDGINDQYRRAMDAASMGTDNQRYSDQLAMAREQAKQQRQHYDWLQQHTPAGMPVGG